jgi:hypothetical protein
MKTEGLDLYQTKTSINQTKFKLQRKKEKDAIKK